MTAEKINYTLENISDDSPLEVSQKLAKICYLEIPTEITSIEAMTTAGALLGKLTNRFSYLTSLSMLTKSLCRIYKKQDKELWDSWVAKRDSLEDACRMTLQQYQAISRMISTKQEINREINMY